MTPRDILNRIASWDPDGQDFGEDGPSNNDYHNFRAVVLSEYGKQAWDDYNSDWAKGEGTYE